MESFYIPIANKIRRAISDYVVKYAIRTAFEADLRSLVCGIADEDMTQVYKYYDEVYAWELFCAFDSILKKAPPSALRGHYKLLKKHCNFQLRLQSFSFRVVNS